MKTYVLLAALLSVFRLFGQSATEVYHAVAIPLKDHSVIHTLQNLGLDLHCGSKVSIVDGQQQIQVDVSESQLSRFRSHAIEFTVVQEDLTSYIVKRAEKNLPKARSVLQQEKIARRSPDVPAIPQNFFLGDMAGFLYYDQILAVLDSMASLYPHLITIRRPLSDSIRTFQGRTVDWVKISDHPDSDEAEPEVLYTAMMHAREPASTMTMLYYMWYLLENYTTDPEVRRIVDHTELYFIPVVNPDGYIRNQTISPQGGGMWRKNLHDNDTNTVINSIDGVDLNRNFGYLWGYDDQGSSPLMHSSTYRGKEAFSEPETQMLRAFINARTFSTAMHAHSYGDDLYHAWDHGASPLPDAEMFYALSDLMAWDNRYLFGQTYNTYWLGAINGGIIDWCYGETEEKPRINTWLAEIGLEFWPDPLLITELCQKQLAPYLMVAEIAGAAVRVHDLNPPAIHFGSNLMKFRIESYGLKAVDASLEFIPRSPGIENLETRDGPVRLLHILDATEIEVILTTNDMVQPDDVLGFDIVLRDTSGILQTLQISKRVDGICIYQQPEEGNLMDAWTSDAWGEIEIAGEKAITDSPEGDQLNAQNTIALNTVLDLTDHTWAVVSFEAQWKIETTYDFVQLQARTPGQPWIPLAGQYTKHGAAGYSLELPSPNAGQPEGQPVYDGRQLTWRTESVDLSSFAGEKGIELRFLAWSGASVSPSVEDGFMFRKFKIFGDRPSHCRDLVQNNDETGVDCGGADCSPCVTCEDGMLNGTEEGIDCGGTCTPCATCSDGMQNGDENGIDCGGTLCSPCADCADGIQNGDETGIDCGGPCAACPPTCSDGIMNGDEEDVDCGGSCPEICKTKCCDAEVNKIWYDQMSSIRIVPNPVRNTITVQLQISQPEESFLYRWVIISSQGIQYASGEGYAGALEINASTLLDGLYVLCIHDTHGNRRFGKFLKQE